MRSHALRGRVSVLAALAVAATSLLVTSTPAHAAAEVDRLSGGDRYETGAAVSKDAFPNAASVDVAYLATGENFADALSAGAAAFANAGPVVLTTPDGLADAARDELRRLQPDRVVVVGGPVAISKAVIDAVRSDTQIGASDVTRIGGDTRFHTAANVVTDAFPDSVSTVFVATGQEFPDALSGVPAAARYEAPLLLTEHGNLPAPTKDALQALDPDRIVILGGDVAVSNDVQEELGDFADDVDRLAGGDRFGTGVAVAEDAFVGARTVYIATGRNFPDALAGGPAAGVNTGPLLLTETDDLPDAAASELLRLNPRRVVILGGPNAITNTVRDEIANVLGAGTALPSGQTPDLAFGTVDNRSGQPTTGYQVINLGTFEGDYESLTNPGADHKDFEPVLSPDGRRLVFWRFPTDGGIEAGDPWIIDVAVGAGSTRKLFDVQNRFDGSGGCTLEDLTWSPSGDQLAFICYGRENADEERLPPQAHVVDLRGETTRIALPGSANTAATGLAYRPDGSRLAVAILDQDASASRIIAVDPTDPAAGSQGEIAPTPQEGTLLQAATSLHWSKDGSTIVGERRSSGGTELLVVNVKDKTADVEMKKAEHDVVGVTDNGDQALVITHGPTDLLRLVPTDGSDPTVIADDDDLQNGQIWDASLDGTDIVFDDMNSEGYATEAQIWLTDVGTTHHTKLFDVDGVLAGTPSLNAQRGGASADDWLDGR